LTLLHFLPRDHGSYADWAGAVKKLTGNLCCHGEVVVREEWEPFELHSLASDLD